MGRRITLRKLLNAALILVDGVADVLVGVPAILRRVQASISGFRGVGHTSQILHPQQHDFADMFSPQAARVTRTLTSLHQLQLLR